MSVQAKRQKSTASSKIPLTIKGVYTSPAPSSGFNLATATAEELEYYGFPPRNPRGADEFSAVQTLISRGWVPKSRILPELTVKKRRQHHRAQKRGKVAGPDIGNNWAGCVITANQRLPKPESPVDGYTTDFSEQQHVNFIGADNHVYEVYFKDLWKLSDLTAFTASKGAPNAGIKSALCAYATTYDQQQHVIYVSADNHIHELVFDGIWSHHDLTMDSGEKSLAQTGSALVGYQSTRTDQEHVIFMDDNNHIHELVYDSSRWNDNDLTNLGFPIGARNTPLAGYYTAWDEQQHIIYATTDGHIHDLFYTGGWQHEDLMSTATPPPTPAIAGSALAGFGTDFNEQQHIDYIGTDGHIHELFYDGSWHSKDLSHDAKAMGVFLPIVTSSLCGYSTEYDDQQHVSYISADGHVQELFNDGTWKHLDLTVEGTCPVSADTSSAIVGYTTDFNTQKQVNFQGTDQHLWELFFADGNWSARDLTAAGLAPWTSGSGLLRFQL